MTIIMIIIFRSIEIVIAVSLRLVSYFVANALKNDTKWRSKDEPTRRCDENEKKSESNWKTNIINFHSITRSIFERIQFISRSFSHFAISLRQQTDFRFFWSKIAISAQDFCHLLFFLRFFRVFFFSLLSSFRWKINFHCCSTLQFALN